MLIADVGLYEPSRQQIPVSGAGLHGSELAGFGLTQEDRASSLADSTAAVGLAMP